MPPETTPPALRYHSRSLDYVKIVCNITASRVSNLSSEFANTLTGQPIATCRRPGPLYFGRREWFLRAECGTCSVVQAVIAPYVERFGPRRVCEVLTPYLTPARMARIEAVLAQRLASVTVVVEDTYDPHNAVAAIRTSEAFGLADFHAISGIDHLRLAPGITRGCDRWIDVQRWPTPAACVAQLRARGFGVYATAPEAQFDLETIDVTRPVAVMFGNEHAGLSAAAEQLCDGAVRIPMFGFTESFNLSVSVALVASRLTARRRAWLGADGDLTESQLETKRAYWMAYKVREVDQLLARLLPLDASLA